MKTKPDFMAFRNRRISAGVPIARLVHVTGVSYTHLCNIDRGLSRPSAELAETLAGLLGTTKENLWLFSPPKRAKVRAGKSVRPETVNSKTV